jgi:sialidase-1
MKRETRKQSRKHRAIGITQIFAFIVCALSTAFSTASTHAVVEEPSRVDVFEAGKDGYHTFRIPSLIATPKGSLIAICEGRKNGRGDSGDIDLVMKRSVDDGATWSPLKTLDDDGENTTGNPTLVVERKSGVIFLLLTRNPGNYKESEIMDGPTAASRTVWLMKSVDDGITWSAPVEITSSVKRPEWRWYATGPGVGIQLKNGRLVIPCNHSEAGTRISRSHIIYSDDQGKTWKLGGIADPNTNESQVVERANGVLLWNMRNARVEPQYYTRAVAESKDGGLKWTPVAHDPMLIEPICQASILRYPRGDLTLFSNPTSLKREKLTVRLSLDGGRTWPIAKVIHEKAAAYSSLGVLKDGAIGLLYENGEKDAYEKISFSRFRLDWLDLGLLAAPAKRPAP